MAEVRKNKKVEKYDISEMKESSEKSDKKVKSTKESKSKDTKSKDTKSKTNKKDDSKKKQSLWVRFRIFWHGVGTELKKVHWPSKYDMVKYSIATIFTVIFLAVLFYLVDILFALVQTLF